MLVHLIPDTYLSELTIFTATCSNCISLDDNVTWTPITPALETSDFTLSYYSKLEIKQNVITGSHYTENACLIDSQEHAYCTMEFYMYGVEQASD